MDVCRFVYRRSSLGFGSEFFELLAKSNNRSEEVRWHISLFWVVILFVIIATVIFKPAYRFELK